MKKAIVAVAIALSASVALAAIAGSDHDLTDRVGFDATWTNTNSPCTFCHVPHFSNSGQTGAPLWNRATNSATYTLYSSTTLDGAVAQPGVNSRTCLSCHDGTVAPGEVYNNGTPALVPGTVGTLLTGDHNVGQDLSNDHPVGVTYGADTTLVVAPTVVRLYTNTVQCGSCHDPHSTTYVNFLRDAPGTLCGRCHTQ